MATTYSTYTTDLYKDYILVIFSCAPTLLSLSELLHLYDTKSHNVYGTSALTKLVLHTIMK